MENLIPKWTYSHSHYQYLREAISKRAFYRYSPSGPNLIHRLRRYNRLYGEYRMVPPTDDPGSRVSDEQARKQIDVLKDAREGFTDLDVDVLDILIAYWLDRRREIEDFVNVDTDEILHARGLQHKVNGQRTNTSAIGRGYTPQQRKAVNQSICRLLLLWGDVRVIHPHDKEDFNGESRILELKNENSVWINYVLSSFKENEDNKTDVNIQKRRSIYYRPGTIFRHFNLYQRMYQPSLIYNYNYRHHWREKRLGRYLLWQWRINQKHDTSSIIKSTASLVDATVLNLDRNRFDQHEKEDVLDIKPEYRPKGSTPSYRRRERFERTLQRLSVDGIIGDWEYHSGWNRSWSNKSNWSNLWIHSDIKFYPSPAVLTAYQEDDTLSAEQRVSSDPPSDMPKDKDETTSGEDTTSAEPKPLATLLLAVKNEHDFTQTELADKIGFSQSYVSAIINGRRTPPTSTTEEIRESVSSLHEE
jgi:DNA-binding XRE family transcriptional regulator